MADLNPRMQQNITSSLGANSLFGLADAPAAVRYLASFAMTAFATVVAVGLDSQVAIPNISLIFVVPVTLGAVGLGLGPSLFSAILGALAYNFFLTEPRYTLIVDDPANVWAIGLLFVLGLIVSSVAFTSRRRAIDAALLRRQAAMLQNYSRDGDRQCEGDYLDHLRHACSAFPNPCYRHSRSGRQSGFRRESRQRRAPGGRDRGGAIVVGNRTCREGRSLSGVDLAVRLFGP